MTSEIDVTGPDRAGVRGIVDRRRPQAGKRRRDKWQESILRGNPPSEPRTGRMYQGRTNGCAFELQMGGANDGFHKVRGTGRSKTAFRML